MQNTLATKKSFYHNETFPLPGSLSELETFAEIQSQFGRQFEQYFPDKLAEKTVVILPSLTLDQQILYKISGHVFYEERLLCLLMLLRMPRTKVVYVTSTPIDATVVDYYLHLLQGITGNHARSRLVMLSCYDASAKSLTEKVLERPRLIRKIKEQIIDKNMSHLACFNVTPFERTLAVQLGIPIFGTDPELLSLGSKSNSRKLFKQCGLPVPEGYEDVKNRDEVIDALVQLKRKNHSLRKAVIKLNDGFSGEGNAIFEYGTIKDNPGMHQQIKAAMSGQLRLVASDLTEALFFEKFDAMGGVVEAFIEGTVKASPSVQYRITPIEIEVVSTHDQLLGGADGQIFLGAYFPASNEYNTTIAKATQSVAVALAEKGVLGRFSIDFISVKEGNTWKHYGIEINLRKGGTTHPLLMLQFLTDGEYNAETGAYYTASGNQRFYFSSDNLASEKYKGLTPPDLIDIAMFHSLMYDGTSQEGVIFHLMGALSQYGKLGVLCIGSTPEKAWEYYERVINVLNHECS
ncbi:peptide ligase PGM1-related protein [Chitinophagaceae bacterium LB-8]|uniref:Peptide ligase PGM1-related protein n=1 Tax=Paraflavisolibacter caeni TaxID=2982496 RepID=A0A9X2XUE9_9BACT|nr:peptide ligase PGM1-related protein [Paraflavisolibacter caeni]MCU7549424.1 peptide ligase PGM1-related protein [Paraflavisolibacter caeni]